MENVCISVCDGLKGLPEAINTVWKRAVVQTCIVHLIRNTFRGRSQGTFRGLLRQVGPTVRSYHLAVGEHVE